MEQPTGNVKLKFENLQQLAEVEGRLSNLNNEISIASKNLRIIKGDSERAIKDKEYQEEMLSIVSAQVIEKQSRATQLDESILEKSDVLAKLNAEINSKTADQNLKDMAFKEREDKIVSRETQLTETESSLNVRVSEQEKKMEYFNQKVSKLKEVISTF